MKTKYDFISEFLESSKLNFPQKERILRLVSIELKKDYTTNEEIQSRLRILEDKIGLADQNKVSIITLDGKNFTGKESSKKEDNSIPKYLHPFNLFKYLLFYNQNPVLKSTCHEIDSTELETIIKYCGNDRYVFERHLEKIIEAFEKHDKKHFAPFQVKSLIRGYITGKDSSGQELKKGWSSNNILFTWSNSELKAWSLENENIPPNIDEGLMNQIEKIGYEFIPPKQLRNGILLRTFSDLVIHFKKLFHLRSDNSLKDIIKRENETKRWSDNIDFEIIDNDFPNNIEFFTDVDKLIQGYNKIIELIVEQSKKQNCGSKAQVKLSLIQTDNGMIFSILHRYSIYGKSVIDATGRLGQAYSNLIKSQLNGLCNFYLKADFEIEGSYEIELWNRPNLWVKEKPIATKLAKPVGGVEHIFEFIKTTIEDDILN
jgi:hypothetical protein